MREDDLNIRVLIREWDKVFRIAADVARMRQHDRVVLGGEPEERRAMLANLVSVRVRMDLDPDATWVAQQLARLRERLRNAGIHDRPESECRIRFDRQVGIEVSQNGVAAIRDESMYGGNHRNVNATIEATPGNFVGGRRHETIDP